MRATEGHAEGSAMRGYGGCGRRVWITYVSASRREAACGCWAGARCLRAGLSRAQECVTRLGRGLAELTGRDRQHTHEGLTHGSRDAQNRRADGRELLDTKQSRDAQTLSTGRAGPTDLPIRYRTAAHARPNTATSEAGGNSGDACGPPVLGYSRGTWA